MRTKARAFAVIAFGGAFLLAGCQITVDENDLFRPEWADGTKFTIETRDGVIFDRNEPRPGLFEDLGVSFDDMTIPSDAGALNVRIARANGQGKPLIVYCGGNTWDIQNHGNLAAWSLAPFGDAALWDYPGFGRSAGEPSVTGFELAADAILAAIEGMKRTPDQKVVFWGHSLGGFVCAGMAGKSKGAAGLILMSTAPSAGAAARHLAPWYLRPFVRLRLTPDIARYDSVRSLERFGAPILVIGAGKDEILPVKLSRELRDDLTATGHRVVYAEFANADHFTVIRERRLDPVIRAFLSAPAEDDGKATATRRISP